jgi:hypothetical protein
MWMVTRDFALSTGTPQCGLQQKLPSDTISRGQNFLMIWVYLQLLVEIARRAGDENPAGDAALAVFDPLYDAGGLATLGAVGALGCVHYFLAVCGLSNLGHVFSEGLFYTRISGLSLAQQWYSSNLRGGKDMKARIFYRAAAVFLLLFAIAHTLGFRQSDPRWGVYTLLASMKSLHFNVQGSSRS